MIYFELLWSFVQIGLFSFGGGYAVLPLIQQQVITQHHWLTVKEFTDVVTISQMTPGPIALNAATFVGMRAAGFPGAVVATVGCALPTALLALIVGHAYFKYRSLDLMQGIFSGLRPAVVSLIATAGLSLLLLSFFGTDTPALSALAQVDWKAVGIFAVCLIVLRRFKANMILVLLAAGAAGAVLYLLV